MQNRNNDYKKGDVVSVYIRNHSSKASEIYETTDNNLLTDEGKDRPAIILNSDSEYDDYVVCITSTKSKHKHSLKLVNKDFKEGKLITLDFDDSYVRYNKIYTISKEHIRFKRGTLTDEKFSEITEKIKNLLDESESVLPQFQRPIKPIKKNR